jgi:type I restriction enzyme S subunit
VEWLGEIPEHWEVKRLKFLAAEPIKNGIGEAGAYDDPDWPRYVRITDISGPRTLREDTFKSLPPELANEAPFKTGDLLLAAVGATYGKSYLHVQDCGSVCFAGYMVRFSPNDELLPDYAAYWSESSAYWALVQSRVVQATIQNFSAAKYKELSMPLPGITEQRAIATFLDRETARIDALVAKKQRLIELLEEQRTALMTRAVTAGLDARSVAHQAGTEVFPLLPLGWETRKLRRILTQKKRPVEVQQDSDYQEIGIRSWGRGIFHKEPLKGALLEEKSVYRIEPGDFVLNIVFAWEGAVAIASEQERGMIGSHRFPTFLVSEEVDPDYLLMVFQIDQGRWLMEVNSPGAAGRNKTIRLNRFLDEEVPLPPSKIQRELVCRVREEENRITALKDRLNDIINSLKELRTALISAAVTGKIDVREEAE